MTNTLEIFARAKLFLFVLELQVGHCRPQVNFAHIPACHVRFSKPFALKTIKVSPLTYWIPFLLSLMSFPSFQLQ
jgi:hypothetical protein